MSRFRVRSTLPQSLEDLGVSHAAVLARAGLPSGLFDGDKVLLTTEEFFALHRAIGESSDDPAFGLKLGAEERVERYDPVAITALSSRSLRDALQRVARYKQLLCPEKIHVVERGDECTVRFEWLLAHEEEPALLTDICFAWVVALARRGVGQAFFPKRVEFHRPPSNREMYEAHFRCPVRFKAGHDALVFRLADVERPFVTRNPELLAIVAPQLDAELEAQLAQDSLGERAKGALKRLIAGRRPGIEELATELRLSVRTLQRRLTEQGVSFQRLLEEARRELARHYLLHSSVELKEAAYLLGYEDASSFFRAFHGWEGVPPGRWRLRQRESTAAARQARSRSSRKGAVGLPAPRLRHRASIA